MEKRIQTWSTIKKGVRIPSAIKPILFKKEGADTLYDYIVTLKDDRDDLKIQLAEAIQTPVIDNTAILDRIDELANSLQPVSSFLDNISKPKPPSSKKGETKIERLARHKEKIRLDALERYKRG